jgi:hypothetical protein
MTDPVALRNLMSNSVYAEQINAAHLQGQESERTRQVRIRQQQVQEEAMSVARTLASEHADVDQDGGGGEQSPIAHKRGKKAVRRQDQDQQVEEGHIDLTI